MTHFASEGKTFWVNGEELQYSAWASGEPKTEKCVVVYNSEWYTVECTSKGNATHAHYTLCQQNVRN